MNRNSFSATLVLLLTPFRMSAQMPDAPIKATPQNAAAFIGNWNLSGEGSNGPASFALSLTSDGPILKGVLLKDEVAQRIDGILMVGPALSLNVTFMNEGTGYPAVITLTPSTLMHIEVAGGLAKVDGMAKRKLQTPVASTPEGIPSLQATLAVGKPATESEPVTFNKHIAPILLRQCVECHRPGQVAPFSLLTYADVKKKAKMIATVTADHIMPPWKSVEGHGSFVGERRLTAPEIELVARWVAQDTPEGKAGDLPAIPQFAEGWTLGQPDIVVKMSEPFDIPAEGRDVYRNFVFDLDIPKGKYIKAAEFRPSNRRVVHHVQLCVDTTGTARKQDEADAAQGFSGAGNPPGQLFPGSLATWTPGRDPLPLPDGVSMPWKQGADFVVQLHLHPSGKPETEQSSVGFYLTDEPPLRSMVDLLLIDMKIDIPPGEPAFRTRAELKVPIDVETVGLFPHMHMIGREFKVTAYPPQGDPVSLLWINDWDFNWQVYYQYAVPVKLTAGTRVVMEALHDNSADNIHNPNQPPKRVKWGEQTTDEMSLAFLQVMPVREEDFPKLGVNERGGKLGVIRAVSGK